jgi:uncharacterized membrane protein
VISGRRLTLALGLALLVSLGANFFLVGFWLSQPEPRGGFAEKVPEADRAVMKREFDSRRDQIEAGRAQLRQASQNVRSALQANPFDRAKLEAALAEMRRVNSEYRAATHQALAASAAQVSPEGRARMAEAPFLRRGERDRRPRD